MRITDLVAKFCGTVTYDDNTTGTFHTQIEKNNVFSENLAEATENLRQISWHAIPVPPPGTWPYWNAIRLAITNLPFLDFAWDTSLPASQKTITDMVAKLDVIMTKDDGSTYCAAIIITGTSDNIRVELPDGAHGATNLADIKESIKQMFVNVMGLIVSVS